VFFFLFFKSLCNEIARGNRDMIEYLLQLGYPMKGFFQIDKTIRINDKTVFSTANSPT